MIALTAGFAFAKIFGIPWILLAPGSLLLWAVFLKKFWEFRERRRLKRRHQGLTRGGCVYCGSTAPAQKYSFKYGKVSGESDFDLGEDDMRISGGVPRSSQGVRVSTRYRIMGERSSPVCNACRQLVLPQAGPDLCREHSIPAIKIGALGMLGAVISSVAISMTTDMQNQVVSIALAVPAILSSLVGLALVGGLGLWLSGYVWDWFERRRLADVFGIRSEKLDDLPNDRERRCEELAALWSVLPDQCRGFTTRELQRLKRAS